jgi:ribonuclease BN (tRNA processing enzyme)
MQPKIIFLGTGGDSEVVSKQRRSSAGFVIRVSGYQFHIDPGPGALVKLKDYGINPRENTAILASHGHINHSHDVDAIISAMTYNGFDKQGVLIASSSVVNGINGEEPISPTLSEFFRRCVERVIVIKPNQRVGIEHIEIKSLETLHNDPTNVGFKIYTPKFTLIYTSDTGYSSAIAKQYEKVDIIIANLVRSDESKSTNHLRPKDVIKILQKAKPKLCILTHFSKKILESDPIYIAREIQKASGVQVIAAVDGLEIHPLSYAVNMKQKTLNVFNN